MFWCFRVPAFPCFRVAVCPCSGVPVLLIQYLVPSTQSESQRAESSRRQSTSHCKEQTKGKNGTPCKQVRRQSEQCVAPVSISSRKYGVQSQQGSEGQTAGKRPEASQGSPLVTHEQMRGKRRCDPRTNDSENAARVPPLATREQMTTAGVISL